MKKLMGRKAGKILLLVLVLGVTLVAVASANEAGAEHKSLITLLAEDPMPLLKDFLWRVLNLAILLWILIKFAGKPLKEYFAGRRDSIQKGVQEAQEAKAEAERIYREYQEKLAGLDDELKVIEERARLEGERESERMRQETEELVAKLQQQARRMAEQEIAGAKRQLRREAAEVALETAEKLVKENISDAARQRMVENYLDKVVRA
jgi:F-type H+-transporting ATPase subunit b